MIKMTAIAAALTLVALVSPSFSASTNVPTQVQAVIEKAGGDCEGRVLQEDGFITRRDVNGDGRADVILNYFHFRCVKDGRRLAQWCGPAGCMYQIFASTPDGYVETELPNCVGVRFTLAHGEHRLTCEGRGDVPGDDFTMVWTARGFVRRPPTR